MSLSADVAAQPCGDPQDVKLWIRGLSRQGELCSGKARSDAIVAEDRRRAGQQAALFLSARATTALLPHLLQAQLRSRVRGQLHTRQMWLRAILHAQ